jgi:hypothetical protein
LSTALNFIVDPSTPTGRLLLVAVVLVALGLVPWVGKALVELVKGVMDMLRIKARGKVWMDLAKLKPEQAEHLRAHLERIRPPPADAIAPPPDDLGSLAYLQPEREPQAGDPGKPGAGAG